ncbi:hypothetical protein OROGR_015850 [Orobanche gracilis]
MMKKFFLREVMKKLLDTIVVMNSGMMLLLVVIFRHRSWCLNHNHKSAHGRDKEQGENFRGMFMQFPR